MLYVPTFRRDSNVDIDSLAQALDEEQYKLIIKLHPLYDPEQISDQTYSTYDWFKACDRVMVMEKGRIIEQGTVDEVYDHPRQEYTKKLLNAIQL